MAESDLKALLEEAITYKRPKDREHKSATFNELLDKTEKEDQEQNFPFTSRPVHSKRASGRPTQGGSLQDLQEAGLNDCYSEFPFAPDFYTNLGGLGVQMSRRHHGGSSFGPGGGDRVINNPRTQKQRYTSSVSSRQREGGSLPSNVNVECSFFNDSSSSAGGGTTITKFKKRDGASSGAKSDYGTMVLTAPLTSAGAAELIEAVAEAAGGAGLCGGMKNTESHLIDGGCMGAAAAAGHTVIDMGELESDETQRLLDNDALQQNLYDSGLDDLDGSMGDPYGSSSTTTSGGSSSSGGVHGASGVGGACSALKKIPRFPTTSYTSHAKLEIGEPSSTVRPSLVHHVDKTVPLPLLESNKSVDITPIQLGSSYQAVKCFMSSDAGGGGGVGGSGSSSVSKQDPKHVMITANNAKYITTQNFSQMISQVSYAGPKYLDENGNSVQQFNSSLLGGSSGSSSSAATVTSSAISSAVSSAAAAAVAAGAAVGMAAGASGNSGGGVGSVLGTVSGGSASGGASSTAGGGKKKRNNKSDRNTVLVIPENIAGWRGKETNIEELVNYIDGKGGGGVNPKNGTVVKVSGGGGGGNGNGNGSTSGAGGAVENGVSEEKAPKKKSEKKKEKAKLKKSNSLEELSSCSRKKQQAEDEQQSQEMEVTTSSQKPEVAETVTLRKAGKKGSQQHQTTSSNSSASSSSTTSSNSSKEGSANNKRGERRSWGTEELAYLEDQHVQQEEKSASSKKREAKEHASEPPAAALPSFNLGKKRDSLRMSVESLSAVGGVSGGTAVEAAEFHVVIKKKKMKKKAQSLFAEDSGMAGGTSGYGGVSNNRRHLGAGQSYNSAGGSRSANSGGKYQTSQSFANDRDAYMNSLTSGSDVSRRKSTSSMPPSEKSDSSDVDSVQSLPIEPSRKQQQQQPSSQQKQGGAVGVSYADIAARIPHADRVNNNLPGAGGGGSNSSNSSSNNTNTSPLDSVEKWPPVQATSPEDLAQALKSPSAFPELVPESEQYQQHQYVNSSVSSVSSSTNSSSNLGSNKATYSQSLLIAAATTPKASLPEEASSTAASGKLVSSVSSEHNVNSSNANANSSTNTSNSKLALHKSKSVDNNDIYYSNEHYPALEKTVKPAKTTLTTTTTASTVAAAAPVATTLTANSTLQEPKSASAGKTSPVALISVPPVTNPVTAANSSVTATTTNNNNNASNGAKKSKKKEAAVAAVTTPANDVESINNARNVAGTTFGQTASLVDVLNNNNNNTSNPVLIEHAAEIDYSQNNGLTTSSRTNGGPGLLQSSTPKTTSTTSSSTVNNVGTTTTSKRSKKEKFAPSTNATTPQQQPQHYPASTQPSANHRPAVIMNDSSTAANEANHHEFTFGFDIDQELLFGDCPEDEQQQQQQNYQKPSTAVDNNVPSPTSNTSVQSTDLGYSSMQQSSSSVAASPSSASSSSSSQQQHHYHNQQQQQQQPETYEMLNSTDPDTYRDSIEHKFHQPPPSMVLPGPGPLYTQPPPQLPPPHVLARQQARPVVTTTAAAAAGHYNLPPPPVQQQPLQPAVVDSATNTSPPTLMTVPPPPLPIPVVATAVPIPVVVAAAQPLPAAVPVVLVPAGPPPVAVVPVAVAASTPNSITSLNNQTTMVVAPVPVSVTAEPPHLEYQPKPQRQAQQHVPAQPQQSQQPIREKIKEINLRFIAPEQLQTNHNHDKIVNFVGMAWEDIICGNNGSAKYYDGK
ncbi:mucin-19 isoform X4 [Culex quinquefasciatus]|nr:mucin-19 isoform X4 [Culex quinquefasciatus]